MAVYRVGATVVRKSIVCRASRNNNREPMVERSSIFQTRPPLYNNPVINTLDIADALEATNSMSIMNKREYFYARGIDYDRVIRYFAIVTRLNNVLDLTGR
jgi:hypothetical protein